MTFWRFHEWHRNVTENTIQITKTIHSNSTVQRETTSKICIARNLQQKAHMRNKARIQSTCLYAMNDQPTFDGWYTKLLLNLEAVQVSNIVSIRSELKFDVSRKFIHAQYNESNSCFDSNRAIIRTQQRLSIWI